MTSKRQSADDLFNWRQCLVAVCVLGGLQQFGGGAYIALKAELAQVAIARAWRTSTTPEAQPQKPWPWADTWPVARLRVPRHNIDLFVLWGATGNALAFGPGYDVASALPGERGSSLIGGHRDTHFKFLQHLQTNTLLSLELRSGKELYYRVSGAEVVDTRLQPRVPLISARHSLLLVTCFPFNALDAGGPLRYVVTATPVAKIDVKMSS